MRLGLLGLGRIGAFHAETLTSLPVVESLVVSDPVAKLAAEAGERLGAQVASTPEALLASGVDGVVIAASTDVHPELILLCVNAGIPAFCEKPVARDSAVAAGLARQVADSGTEVHIGYPRRFDAAGCTPSGRPLSIQPRPPRITSRCPAGSSVTAACMISTPSAGSPARK